MVLDWRQRKEIQFYIAGTKMFFDFLSCIRNHSNEAEVVQWLISNDKSLGYGVQHSVAMVRCSADIHMEGLNKTKMTFNTSFVQHTHTQDKMANFKTSFLYADLLLITLDNVRLS